ncbi:hypothetical protein [Jannaschia aquimarina]|uniref:Uncharacterized protein n=1 Tax=Jannaschia aquimarina TaxID=935700 RepID=A0A0D1D6G6_9RHOB|nr:hypothetical protein [Jannaschia aquimarina]KIT15583.1 hypothetical protein jaqu_26800 [Jannaschia aquimarina]SNT27271.1 hypothetical protein SAMN05421775_109134 [Jannaschia aquimarina]
MTTQDLLKTPPMIAAGLLPIVVVALSVSPSAPYWPWIFVEVHCVVAYVTMPPEVGSTRSAHLAWHLACPLLIAGLMTEGLVLAGAPREEILLLLGFALFALLTAGNTVAYFVRSLFCRGDLNIRRTWTLGIMGGSTVMMGSVIEALLAA